MPPTDESRPEQQPSQDLASQAWPFDAIPEVLGLQAAEAGHNVCFLTPMWLEPPHEGWDVYFVTPVGREACWLAYRRDDATTLIAEDPLRLRGMIAKEDGARAAETSVMAPHPPFRDGLLSPREHGRSR
jgi:hypothetical protein